MPDFQMYRGDNAAFDLTLTRLGAPVNLAGATLRYMAKRSKDDADAAAVISKVSTDVSQINITDAPNGEATVFLVPDDTSALTEVTVLFYDVQITDATGKVYTVASGKLKILLDVTRTA